MAKYRKIRESLRHAVPVLVAAFLFGMYLIILCSAARNSGNSDADLICSFKWIDGLILLISYAAVNVLIAPLFAVNTIESRLGLSLLIYCVSYALLAFPYWVASVINFPGINVFFHVLVMIVFSEAMVYIIRKKIRK